MRSYNALVSLVALSSVAWAHPGPHPEYSGAELFKREIAARDRHLRARDCASAIAEFTAQRRAKRSLSGLTKRETIVEAADDADIATTTATAAAPHYTTLQNTTCVLAPEVTEGPYYINNELVRQDLRETQPGVTLVLDVGVMDINTCTPIPDAFVEIWAANATGVYGGYGTGGGGAPPPGGGGGGPPGGGGGAPPTSPLARNETFLRGGSPTGKGGVVELQTIYPGFYAGRTAHVHTMIHLNYKTATNGTLISHAGSLIHNGQFFFEESWNDKVFALSPYTLNTNSRTLNANDGIFHEENSNGNNAYLALELLGKTVGDGILGYITVGVDSKASYTIVNTNYLNSTGPN